MLIKWHRLPAEDATWEHLDEFRSVYPDFQHEDELFFAVEERCYDRNSLYPPRAQQRLKEGVLRAVRGYKPTVIFII